MSCGSCKHPCETETISCEWVNPNTHNLVDHRHATRCRRTMLIAISCPTGWATQCRPASCMHRFMKVSQKNDASSWLDDNVSPDQSDN